MKHRRQSLRRLPTALPIIAMLCLLAFTVPGRVQAQAVGAAGGVPVGETNPQQQPLPGQQLGSNLSLNQTAAATNAENQSLPRYGIGLQVEGGAQTNFFGTETNQATAGYIRFAANGAINLNSPRNSYFALYQPRYTVYPQYTNVNNYAQTFFQNVTHAISEHLWLYWDTTANRSLSLDQYLPQSLGIGSIGVVVPNLQTLLLANSFESTNAATNLRLRYLINERWTLTAALTAGYFLTVPVDLTHITGAFSEHLLTTGADLRLDDQWTPRDTIGAELTPLYILGLDPKGHVLAETLEGLYKRQFTASTSATIAAGPLFFQTSTPGFKATHNNSYAVNASINHMIRQSQISAGYSRAFVASFLTPATVAQQAMVNAYVPLRHRWVATAVASYAHVSTSSNPGGPNFGSYGGALYGGTAQIAYVFNPGMEFYALYSRGSDDLTYGTQQSYTFTQDKIGAGIRFSLGNPSTFGGAQ